LSQPELRRVLLVVGLLGLVTVGDGFTYLSWSDAGSLATKYFPLLFVGTSAAYMALAIPFGRMADRAGGARVFLAGHVALFGVYAAGTSGIGGGAWSVLVAPLLLGSFYAATDGLLSALATQSEPEASADSSLVATTTSVGRPLLCAGRLSTARRRHKSLGDIESWRVTVDGRPLRSVDRNF
jgi:MFS family permease